MNMSDAGKLGYIKSKATLENKYKLRVATYNLNPTKCLCCGNTLHYTHRHNKFCGHSCSAKLGNLGVQRNFSSKIVKINNKLVSVKITKSASDCLYCNNPLKHWRRKFCNLKCMQNHMWHIKKANFRDLKTFPSDKTAKRYLMEKEGSVGCKICGNTLWLDKPILLLLDHIDGNSCNLSKDNFRLICSNCDTTLPTYKNRNKGKGRFSRRLRYKNNKSY